MPQMSYNEANRVLKKYGFIVVGLICESELTKGLMIDDPQAVNLVEEAIILLCDEYDYEYTGLRPWKNQ